jgi:beta-1,4-mannosyl-glycoprotein beta-1,4-N-acetylglucosaminyltransferase
MPVIYDCFMFFNELELLELRLHELSPVVDRFVLVEATRSHSNRPKPLVYAENQDRFRAFADRIAHVVVEDSPDTPDAWAIEKFQRDAAMRALAGCREDDAILISDVDEIPRAAEVLEACRGLRPPRTVRSRLLHRALRSRWIRHPLRPVFKRRHPFLVVFEMTPYVGHLNLRSRDCCLRARLQAGTRLCLHRDLTRPRELRGLRGRVVRDGGWHFSSMGGVDRVREKLAATPHREYDTPAYSDPERLARRLARGADIKGRDTLERVEIDSSYPRYVVENPERWRAWIMPPSRATP